MALYDIVSIRKISQLKDYSIYFIFQCPKLTLQVRARGARVLHWDSCGCKVNSLLSSPPQPWLILIDPVDFGRIALIASCWQVTNQQNKNNNNKTDIFKMSKLKKRSILLDSNNSMSSKRIGSPDVTWRHENQNWKTSYKNKHMERGANKIQVFLILKLQLDLKSEKWWLTN